MKQIIKGITYDTERSKEILEWDTKTDRMECPRLCETPSGHCFVLRTHYYFNGRKLPANLTMAEFNQKYIVRKRGGAWLPVPGLSLREVIQPISRRRALAFALRATLPRTFHKDLARYLK